MSATRRSSIPRFSCPAGTILRAFYRACWQPFGIRLFHAGAWTATGSLASGPTGTGWLAECN